MPAWLDLKEIIGKDGLGRVCFMTESRSEILYENDGFGGRGHNNERELHKKVVDWRIGQPRVSGSPHLCSIL